MHPHRPQFIILCPRHEPFTEPLIDHEDDLGRDLRAQEPGFLRAGILPLGEILGHPGALDAGGSLRLVAVAARASACAATAGGGGGSGGGAVGVRLRGGGLLREHDGGRRRRAGLLRLVVLLHLLRMTRWSEMVGGGRGGEEEWVHAWAVRVRGRD